MNGPRGVCDTDTDFWTVLELCAGGRLAVFLEKFPRKADPVALQLCQASGFTGWCIQRYSMQSENPTHSETMSFKSVTIGMSRNNIAHFFLRLIA